MINLSAGSPGFNSCQSYHYPIRDNDGQYCASNTISSVYPETLLIYALNDPYPDDIFNHAENNKLLSERGVYTLPVTSFLLATNPPVRPMNIEILEQALAHPQIGLTQFDIDELKKIQCSNQTVKHQDLCLLKKHSQWGKIVTLKEKFIADLESHCLNDCKRIIIFLHGNMNDDDSFTTSCFGTCPSAFEKRLFICQNIETLSDAISTLFNSFCSIFGGNKVVDVEFATCSDFESEKLYRNFEKHLNILNKDVSVKVFYFSSWRLMIINYDAQNVAGSFLCFSDLDSLYFSAGFNDISGEFSYPFHSCNNQSIGFYKGECDWLVSS